jgi:hypothetical protein
VFRSLVEVRRFSTAAEASIVCGRLECEGIRAQLAGEEAANCLWHLGTAIGGVRLLVNREDARRAVDVLRSVAAIDDLDDIDFGDRSDEPCRDDAPAELPEDLLRAWRASLIGVVLLPPILNIYSMWLLFRHRFFLRRCRDWRVLAACVVNAVVLGLVGLLVLPILLPRQQLPMYFAPDGQPVDVKYLKETHTIRILP